MPQLEDGEYLLRLSPVSGIFDRTRLAALVWEHCGRERTRGLMVDMCIRVGQAAVAACTAVLLAACTGGVQGDGSNNTMPAPQYTIGGTVSGLGGSGLVLAINTGETLSLGGNGSFTFKTTFPSGSPYYVLVLSQPSTPTQTCLATKGAGTVESNSVTSIAVVCQDKVTATDAVGGTIVGLTGSGLVLQNNGVDTLTVSSNGSFVFPTALPSGSQYNISIVNPPINPYQDCEVLNGKGLTGDSDIASIGIICTVNNSPPHTIGGTVSGVSGTLVLQDNGRDDLTITAAGEFKFPLAIPSGSSYEVTTKSAAGVQSQACTFTNATGTVGNSDINNVVIACAANVSLEASVSGLAGTGLVLQNTSNGDNLTVAANGTSAFPTGLASGQAYNVTIAAQPTNPWQTCVVANGAGPASTGSGVTVTCTTNTYSVSGVINGLPDPDSGANIDLVLQDNLGETVTIHPTDESPFPFTFTTPMPSGSTYSITVQAQPGVDTSNGTAGVVQTSTVCIVSANTGTITNANTSVVINCVRPLGFAYVTNSGDNTISPYIIDSDTGALLPSGQPVSAGTGPSSATVSGNSLLYVSNSGSGDVSGYAIDPNTGSLTPLSGSPFTPGWSAVTSIAAYNADAGTGLYATHPGSQVPGSISAITLGSSGTSFTNIAGSPFATQFGATAGLFFDGGDYPTDYKYYLETDSASNTVSVYLVNSSTGALAPVTNSPFAAGAGPHSVAGIRIFVSQFESNFDHVYVANSGDGTISVYGMDTQSGALTAQGAPVTLGTGLSAVAASVSDPCGCYLFASAAQGVWGFSTNQGGVLTPLPNSPYAAGSGPGPIATLDANVFVVNTVDETISAFAIAPASGGLVPVTGAAVKTGQIPSAIVVTPRPRYDVG